MPHIARRAAPTRNASLTHQTDSISLGSALAQTLFQTDDGAVDQRIGAGLVEAAGDHLGGRRDGDVDGVVADVGDRLGLGLGDFFLGELFAACQSIDQPRFGVLGLALGFLGRVRE